MPDAAGQSDDSGLKQLREAARAALADCGDTEARRQYHPDLSPLAWHLGHVFFVETYWLREVVCGDARDTAPWRELFFPEFNAKDSRAAQLPPLAELLAWTRRLEADNRSYWRTATAGGHRLMADGYLAAFLRQHYAQHLETMALVHGQRALCSHDDAPRQTLHTPATGPAEAIAVAGGDIVVGSDDPHTYDNEQPAHLRRLADFRIADTPVTNAEWLAFVEDGGYRRDALWSQAGRQWRDRTGAAAPQHWYRHPEGGWYCPDPAEPLHPDSPVHGICAHEADAFARWAGARLPHEHEHEHAVRTGSIGLGNGVWAWCANALFPYPGFRAFPYDGYSMPWFDGKHRVLRGASSYTYPEVRRATFRNFYPESHRHVRAGLRLAW